MSRFFKQTRKPGAAQNADPVFVPLDLDEAVATLKKSGHAEEERSPASFEPLFGIFNESNEIASQLATVRLEKCRKISLPRDNERLFLTAQYNPAMQLAVEAYRTLRTRLVKRQTERGTRSLVICSAEQGEGKTLTSLNLALCYANIQHWPVLLIDADLRTRGLSRLLGDPDSPGIAGILESGRPYEAAILATNVENLYVLPAGNATSSPGELFAMSRWKDVIGWCAESFRLVIVDSPPVLGLSDFELISGPCESVLMVVRSRKSGRDALTTMRQQLDTKKLVGAVLNFATDASNKKYYSYGYGRNKAEEKPKPAKP